MEIKLEEKLIQFKLDGKTRTTLFLMIGIGVVSLLAEFFVFNHLPTRHAHSNPGWSSFLVSVYLVLGISISGIFFTALSHLTGSHWSVTTRRLMEGIGLFVPVVAIFLLVLILGLHDLYEWTHEDVVAKDHILLHKKPLLNTPFFIGRLIFFGFVWSTFAFVFYKKSTKQDLDKDVKHTSLNAKLGGGFILIFALTYSLASFDLLMSLTPHWFSTMFGIYTFAMSYQTGLSFLLIMIYFLKSKGYLGNLVNENHYHDIGKFLFGFCVFYAYVAFSQFFLIWYANVPEETFFYEQRLTGGWQYVSYLLPAIKFVIPFFLLINRPNKRNLGFASKVGAFIIIAQIIEYFWLIFPANFPNFSFLPLIFTFGACIGTVGLLMLVVLKIYEKNSLIPKGDPRLEDSLNHHQ